MVPAEGIEPPTFGLQNRCSTAELSRHINDFSSLWERRDAETRFLDRIGTGTSISPLAALSQCGFYRLGGCPVALLEHVSIGIRSRKSSVSSQRACPGRAPRRSSMAVATLALDSHGTVAGERAAAMLGLGFFEPQAWPWSPRESGAARRCRRPGTGKGAGRVPCNRRVEGRYAILPKRLCSATGAHAATTSGSAGTTKNRP